jgi:hypothetical protein
MEKRPPGVAWNGHLSPDLHGVFGDVSDFVRLAGQAAFQQVYAQSEDGNQRTGDRRHYPFRQRIAPILSGARPSEEQFKEVPFSDISATGVSFLWEGDLGSDRLVVELGAGGNVSQVAARVIWVERLESSPSGSSILRVGCELMGPVGSGDLW